MKTKVKRLSKRSLSMFLAVLMMVSAFVVMGTVTASAIVTSFTVYCVPKKIWSSYTSSDTIKIRTKPDASGWNLTKADMTKVPDATYDGEDIWQGTGYKDGGFNNLQFSRDDGSNWSGYSGWTTATGDYEGKIYDGTNWRTYVTDKTTTLYVKKSLVDSDGWTNIYFYNEDNVNANAWPGVSTSGWTSYGDYYKYELTKPWNKLNVILNKGKDKDKTADMSSPVDMGNSYTIDSATKNTALTLSQGTPVIATPLQAPVLKYNNATTTPVDVTANSINLTWADVSDASSYTIYKDDSQLATNVTSPYTVSETGSYTVKAIGDGTDYSDSDPSNAIQVNFPKTSALTFNLNGGSGTAQTGLTATYGSAMPSYTNATPTKTGYTFAGFYDAQSGGTQYYTSERASAKNWDKNTTDETTLYAQWTEVTCGIKIEASTNGTNGDTTGGTVNKNSVNVGVATSGDATATAQTANGYSFTGWTVDGSNKSHIKLYTDSGCNTDYAAGDTSATTIYIKTDGTSGLDTSNAIVRANFQKKHYMTVYNTTLYDRGHWIVLGSPPQTVKVIGANGVTKTYKYGAGTATQRGEDNEPQGAASTTHIVNTDNATYYEGNKLEIYSGDKVEMTYSALASSEIISGVFYNNSIRYTTELEDDNLYYKRTYREGGYGARDTGSGASYHDIPDGAVPDDDVDYYYDANYDTKNDGYDGHALYANANYYMGEERTTIEGSAGSYAATVNQDTHTVSWDVADRDYLNIDVELSSKKEIHFSDKDNIVVNSIHTDDYYAIGENVSSGSTEETRLAVYAKGNSEQTNTITQANVKLYYCNNMGEYINPTTGKVVKEANRVELADPDNTITVNISSGTSIANSGASNSSAYIYFTGTMPATDVMVDLDLTVSYSLTLRSKIQSDTIGSKTALGQVASLQMGSTTYNKNDSCTISTNCATGTYTAGTGVTLKATPDSGYMFVGWYSGTSSGPDLDSEPLSTNATFSYKPTKAGYIWAVGTRDLYIAGSKYLFNDSVDWQNANHKMKFDASLGTKGKYYWEIDETIFAAANRAYTCPDNGTTTTNTLKGYFNSGSTLYWNINNEGTDNHGNAYFQFIDVATGQSDDTKKTVWGNVLSFEVEGSNIKYGKVLQRDADGDGGNTAGSNRCRKGQGFINFNETTYAGYSTPIRIYFDPSNNTFTVEPTPVYPHVYLSNGYKGLDVAQNGTPSAVTIKVNSGDAQSNNTNNTTYTDMVFNGTGWNPSYEGHVSDITVKARNATLTLTKTTSSANYKVSNFLVYNLTKNTVKAYPASATGTANQYSCNTIKTSDDDSLYIIPLLEYIGSNKKMTVVVDSSKLDYKQWGKIVACYAWSGSGDNHGPYPGQPMVPADDGKSWKTTFECASLTGITFSNYVNDKANTTFLDTTGTLGTVSDHTTGTASGGRINVYNHIDSDDNNYDRTNFKAQTYDYREPIAYYNNQPAGASNTVLTFSIKSGDSKLLAWRDSELRDLNILTYKQDNPTWSDIDFEYLTDSSGENYSDLNGFSLPEKPTASFYIAAKAMVIYNDNVMTRVFSTGKYSNSNTVNSLTYPDVIYNDYKGRVTGEIDMNFAVQWYIYDASGKYITTCLSAGFADKNATHEDMSVVTQRLLDLGYAVEGRSVKICYDMPRFCYSNDNNKPSSGSNFDVYRFTGQWYMDNEYKTAKVYSKVGLRTDNGDEVADSSTAAYGSTTVSVNNSLCTIAGHSGTGTEDDVDYGYTTIVDGDKGAITLKADSTNFIGWYHYNSDGELELDTKDATFRPSYSKDTTFIAMYEAKANYRYNYEGRQGAKSYRVGSSVHLDEDEIANGNRVKTDSTHLSDVVANSPGENVFTRFKKDVTWATPTTEMLSNTKDEYVLDVNNSSFTTSKFTLTAHYGTETKAYKNSSDQTQIEYNTAIDMTDFIRRDTSNAKDSVWDYAPDGQVFQGWYTAASGGKLLSTQANYGQVIIKNTEIYAHFGNSGLSPSDTWEVSIDDQGVTREMTSHDAGTLYNDSIVCVHKTNTNLTTLGANEKVGVLVVDSEKANRSINSTTLANYAAAINKYSGQTASAKAYNTSNNEVDSSTSVKVTNVFTSTVTNFGRADLAAKYSYGSVINHYYHIYAYYYDGENYHFNTTSVDGQYS